MLAPHRPPRLVHRRLRHRDPVRAHVGDETLEGSVGKTAEDFRAAVALISNGSVDLKPLVSNVIALSELAAELPRTPAGAVQRVVVRHPDP